MIISHSKKFIFIHIYKVAGTSISDALKKYEALSLNSFRVYRFLSRNYPNLFPNKLHRHVTARELQQILPPEIFKNYFKFAFVRNPWDWQVSLYYYMLKRKDHHQYDIISKMNFVEYIDWVVNTDITLQKDMLFDESNQSLVDFIGKFENLEQDFQKACETIGITDTQLPHVNKSPRNKTGYRDYYNERAKDLIGQAYKADIELFGYEF